MATKTPRICITLSDPMRAWIEDLTQLMYKPAPASTAAGLLTMLAGAMELELKRFPLTENEANCLADVLGGSIVTTGPVLGSIVLHEAMDAFRIGHEFLFNSDMDISSYGTKHRIDEDVLLDKLRRLSPIGDLALRLAIARWWKSDEPRDYGNAGLTIVTAVSG